MPVGGSDDPLTSQWFSACTGLARNAYPYASKGASNQCNTREQDSGIAEAGAFPGCVGGYPGLFDMSGNAAEWVDDCGDAGCRVRGGSFLTTVPQAACASLDSFGTSSSSSAVGIRCCADL